ncbi:MAG TPA: metallophosphoesterase [Opitutales bacterium]|nr:metallophosphoesterase [Opitutales bacterium]
MEEPYVATTQHTPQGVRWLRVMERTLSFLAKISLVYAFGRQQALRIQIVKRDVPIKNLSQALDGLRILQVSDLHLDRDSRITAALIKKLDGLDYDLVVLTGDYRSRTLNSEIVAIQRMSNLVPHFKAPVFGILGNHDNLAMIPPLEAMGIQLLVNESAFFEHNGEKLYLAGVDDPHHYKLDDIKQACAQIPPGACTILLSHSPGNFREAADLGIPMMLAGHTHGGQVCTPWGKPIQTNTQSISSAQFSGSWSYNGLQGYTSRGVGCCGVPVRLFCPPEITIHTLRKQTP